MGLVSYGIGSRHRVSCGTRKGAVYVNVLHYLRWINKVKNSDVDSSTTNKSYKIEV